MIAQAAFKPPLLLVLEGANDIDFLVRLASRLRVGMADVPDLERLAKQKRIALLPLGGGDPASWPLRFAALGHPEFHLYDREQGCEVDARVRASERLNARRDCRGFVTRKRSLENYLHPTAIAASGDGEITFGDDDPVAEFVARTRCRGGCEWTAIPWRKRRQLIQHAKRRLNTAAVERMNVDLLAERDPVGEVLGWLRTIQDLLRE